MTATEDLPAEDETLVDRSVSILRSARYLTLATVSDSGQPWAAVLQYAWLFRPLRFVVGSAIGAQHSRDVAASPVVAGALYVAGDSGLDPAAIDGAQFTGRCRELDGADLDDYYDVFYRSLFPDDDERREWTLPRHLLEAPAPHRLYLVEVERWWIVDTRTWAEDRIDKRVEVALDAL